MGLMPYEPHVEGCAKCGRPMGEHPVPPRAKTAVCNHPSPEVCKAKHPSTWDDPDYMWCEAFIDPEFVAGIDGEEETTDDIVMQATKKLLSLDGPVPEPRSTVHGVSVGGYADAICTRHLTCHNGPCLEKKRHTNLPDCPCFFCLLIKRRAEIERVQPAFRRAWKRFWHLSQPCCQFLPWSDRWDDDRGSWVSTFFSPDHSHR